MPRRHATRGFSIRLGPVRAPPYPRSLRSRSGFRDQTAETALASGIFGNSALKRCLIEIRPVDRHEHQFAVGRLPHQKIGQALFAAGADNQVRIRDIWRVEVSANCVNGNRGRVALSIRNFTRQPLRGIGDFLPRSVVESDDETEPRVIPRQFFCLVEKRNKCQLPARRARRSPSPARRHDAGSPNRCG